MVNRLLWILFLLLPLGCAELPKVPERTLDSRLASYMLELEQYYGITTNISVIMADLENNVVGRCVFRGAQKTIYIDLPYFNSATPENIEEIMLHEFGHCAFNREHHGQFIIGGPMHGCIDSVMHPYVMSSYTHCWRDFKEYYLEELRSNQEEGGHASPKPYDRSGDVI